METNYYDKIYNDLDDTISFKFKKLNPVEVIQLVTDNINIAMNANKTQKQEFMECCLDNVLWSEDGVSWIPLLDSNKQGRCAKLDSNPSIYFDLFQIYKRDVLTPVFIESRTFQTLQQSLEENKTVAAE